MESNVIAFPKAKKNHPPQSIDEVIETVVSSRKEHVEMFLEGVLPLIFSNAYDFGLDLSKPECNKPTALFIESLKAALYSSCNLDHVLHEFSEQAFEMIDEDFVMKSEVDEIIVDINKE